MSENEDWYDRVIAPRLAELAEQCRDRGLSFLAVVEYEPGRRAETRYMTPDPSLEMTMIQHVVKTAPNLDGYVIGLIRYCREKGIDTGGSMVMRRLSDNGSDQP